MSRNAEKLVKGLFELGYIVNGYPDEANNYFYILRNHGQPMMNKAAGECAPCWELRCNALRHSYSNRIISHGYRPNVQFPDGTIYRKLETYSFYPLTWIVKTPIAEWDVCLDDYGDWFNNKPNKYSRLLITTTMLPDTW
jgi:hypothetical protein